MFHFIAADIIEADKDFDAAWIKEMIASRVLISEFPAMITLLEPHMSSNEMNGAKFAVGILNAA